MTVSSTRPVLGKPGWREHGPPFISYVPMAFAEALRVRGVPVARREEMRTNGTLSNDHTYVEAWVVQLLKAIHPGNLLPAAEAVRSFARVVAHLYRAQPLKKAMLAVMMLDVEEGTRGALPLYRSILNGLEAHPDLEELP